MVCVARPICQDERHRTGTLEPVMDAKLVARMRDDQGC